MSAKTAHASAPIRCAFPGSISIIVITHDDGRVSLAMRLARSGNEVRVLLDPAGVQQLRSALDIPPLMMVTAEGATPVREPEEPLAIIGQGDSQREIRAE